MRPSEVVVVSTVVLFLSPCCPGLDWWRRISTSDLTQQRVDEERRAVENTGVLGRAADFCDITLCLFRVLRAAFLTSGPVSHLGMLISLLRGRRATLLKATLTPTATTRVKEITPPIT